jgi:hypothetical protein
MREGVICLAVKKKAAKKRIIKKQIIKKPRKLKQAVRKK